MNISSLSQVTTAATALSNLILVTPKQTVGYQPQNAPSYQASSIKPPPALLFHYEGEQSVSLESDITDHFIENNSAIQDQIALKPEMVTVQGFIGELNDVVPAALEPLKTIAEKLTVVGAYTPQLSAAAILAYNEASFLYAVAESAAKSAIGAWSSINGGGGESVINGSGINIEENQNKQQVYFQQFYGYWKNRTLFTVQTPWAIFQDMAISRLRAIQDPDTRVITTFEVSFKLMRFAATQEIQTELYNNNNMTSRAFQQGAKQVEIGTQAGKAVSLSSNDLVTRMVVA